MEARSGSQIVVLLLGEQRLERELEGVRVLHHDSLERAKGALLEGGFDCVLVDFADGAGKELERELKTRAPQAPVLAANGATGEGLVEAIQRAIESKRAELARARSATHDKLTGLPNRSSFLERLAPTLGRLERRSRSAAVLFVGLDGFADVNGRFGRQVGDRLLVAVAERLRFLVRPGDTVARFGADEFMLLCDDVASEEDATSMTDRLGAELALPFELDDLNVTVGVSIGIVLAHDRMRPPGILLREAERAMRAAKRRQARWELAKAATADRASVA